MNWVRNLKELKEISSRKILKEPKENPYDFIKKFPEYKRQILDSPEHPFQKCKSLSHRDKNGKINNKFSGTDTEETFKKNLLKTSDKWKYKTKEVIYNVNDDGYRTYQWSDINDWSESIVLFGCSCTFGIGLAEDETISYNLEKMTGRRVINLGVPGGSNYVIANNCASLINYFGTPYAAVFNWTDHNRMRYYYETDFVEMGTWNKDKEILFPSSVDSPWRIDPYKIIELSNKNPFNSYALNQNLKNSIAAMLKDCKNIFNITFFEPTHYIMNCEKYFSGLYIFSQKSLEKKARDLHHPGSSSMFEIAEYINEKLLEK